MHFVASYIAESCPWRVVYNRVWTAREQATKNIFGNVDKNYDYRECLRLELLRRNPESHVNLMLEPDKAFLRMFMSLTQA